MTEFWDKPAEKSGKVLEAFLEGLPLVGTAGGRQVAEWGGGVGAKERGFVG